MLPLRKVYVCTFYAFNRFVAFKFHSFYCYSWCQMYSINIKKWPCFHYNMIELSIYKIIYSWVNVTLCYMRCLCITNKNIDMFMHGAVSSFMIWVSLGNIVVVADIICWFIVPQPIFNWLQMIVCYSACIMFVYVCVSLFLSLDVFALFLYGDN